MNKTLPLLLLPLMISAASGQEASIPFSATVRQDDSAPQSFELEVPSGTVETVELKNGLRLEFTAPADPLDYVMVRVLKEGEDGKLFPLHTVRQPLEDNLSLSGNQTPPNAYLVCGDQVTFFSPPPKNLPECRS